MEETIIIGNVSYYGIVEQATNLLFLPPTGGVTFERLLAKVEKYQSSGYKFLTCVFSTPDGFDNRPVRQGKRIYLVRSKGQFFVNFIDNDSEFHSELIDRERNQSLIEKLNLLYEINLKESQTSCLVEDLKLKKDIFELVGSLGGVFQKICHTANRIYYAAGLLLRVLDKAKEEKLSISEALFELQYEPSQYAVPDLKKLWQTDRLYWLGLEKLKQYNDELQLINPINYFEFTTLNITEEEKLLLLNHIDNETKLNNCGIM